MMKVSKLELATTGLTAASAAIFLFTFFTVNRAEADLPFILAEDMSVGPMIGLLFGAAFLATATQHLYRHRDDNTRSWMAMIGAAMVMMAACFVLVDGFGPAHSGEGWNQPSNDMEKGVFGGIWGGMLVASTAILACNLYKPKTEKDKDDRSVEALLSA